MMNLGMIPKTRVYAVKPQALAKFFRKKQDCEFFVTNNRTTKQVYTLSYPIRFATHTQICVNKQNKQT